MERIPIGIIGCGGHAQHHAENYLQDFRTVNVWDPSAEQRTKIKSVRRSRTLAKLLEDKDVQAVLIGSPDGFHLTQIEMAIAAGKHVFCEKPLTSPDESLSRLEAMFDLAEEKKLVLTSCHPRRYDTPIMWLKSFLPQLRKDLGQVISFDFDFSYHKPVANWKHERSLMLDHINHEVDLMNFLFGRVGFEAWKLHDSANHYEVAGRRDDVVMFHFRGTRYLSERNYPEWCRIRFKRGEVVPDMMMGQASVSYHGRKQSISIPGISIDYDGRLSRVMQNFATQIRTGKGGYLTRGEMLMNTEAGIILQEEGIQRINYRS